MKNNENHTIQDLVAKFAAGEATQQEINKVNTWGQESNANKDFIDNFLKVWELANNKAGIQKELPIDVDAEWKSFLRNRQEDISAAKTISMPTGETRASTVWLRVAAIFLFAILSSYAIYYFINSGEKTYYAENTNTEYVLPDGSQITLNAGSELSFRKNFNSDKRTVKLRGEAFFEVTPDPEKPFIVELDNSNVTVVGTSFNIQAIPEFKTTEVVVVTGKVKFASKKLNEEVLLLPGEKGDFNKSTGKIIKKINTNVNYLSWKTRSIQFEGTTIQDVIKTLQSVYQVKINIDQDVATNCPVTVSFNNQTLDAVMNVLIETLDLTIEVDNEIITITGSGC